MAEEPQKTKKQYCIIPTDNLDMLQSYLGKFGYDQFVMTEFNEFIEDAKKGVYAYQFFAERHKKPQYTLLEDLKINPKMNQKSQS